MASDLSFATPIPKVDWRTEPRIVCSKRDLTNRFCHYTIEGRGSAETRLEKLGRRQKAPDRSKDDSWFKQSVNPNIVMFELAARNGVIDSQEDPGILLWSWDENSENFGIFFRLCLIQIRNFSPFLGLRYGGLK